MNEQEQLPTDLNNSEPPNESDLKEKEYLLKVKELSLKEQELNNKHKTEKTNMWLSSPVLIAIVSTIFGTALGAGLQGYANLQLERQKFELSIIQKSLEVEDKLIENQNDRKESANKLLFLVNSGIIQSLNSDSIKKLANNPDNLPTFRKSVATGVKFYCEIVDNIPHTISNIERGKTPIIKWKNSYNNMSPERRCLEASRNLQRSHDSETLRFITSGMMNGKNVICATRSAGGACESELFDFEPSDDPNLIIRNLMDVRAIATGSLLAM